MKVVGKLCEAGLLKKREIVSKGSRYGNVEKIVTYTAVYNNKFKELSELIVDRGLESTCSLRPIDVSERGSCTGHLTYITYLQSQPIYLNMNWVCFILPKLKAVMKNSRVRKFKEIDPEDVI